MTALSASTRPRTNKEPALARGHLESGAASVGARPGAGAGGNAAGAGGSSVGGGSGGGGQGSARIFQSLSRMRAPGYHRMYTLRRVIAAMCLCMAVAVSVVQLHQPTVLVSFYATDIAAGQLLGPEDIQQRQVPEQGQQLDLIVQPEQVIGAMVVHSRQAGSQIYADDVITNQQLPHAPNMQLVPITLAEASVSDLLVPGDHIRLIPPVGAMEFYPADLAVDQLEAVVMISAHSVTADAANNAGGNSFTSGGMANPRMAIDEGMILVAVPQEVAGVVAGLAAQFSFAVVITHRAGAEDAGAG